MSPVQAPARLLADPAFAETAPAERLDPHGARPRPGGRAARPRKAPLAPSLPDDDWQEQGACRGANPSLFFAPDHESSHQRRFRETAAKAVCAHCPVRNICHAYALQTGEVYGIWGGTTERERLRTPATHQQRRPVAATAP